MKQCSYCNQTLPIKMFSKDKNTKDGKQYRCKKCASEYFQKIKERYRQWKRQYRLVNRGHHLQYNKKWRANNREYLKKYCQENRESKRKYYQENKKSYKKYYQKNKRHLIEYVKKHRRKRIKKEPKFKLDCAMAVAIGTALKGQKKGRKWESLAGYTCEDLMRYLESLFDNKMNWGNYGKYWHVDHIIPISLWQYTKPEDREFKQCWSLANLQPLEANANFSKHNRTNDLIPKEVTIIKHSRKKKHQKG